MDSAPSLGAPLRSIAASEWRPGSSASWELRVLRLSTWMMVLGTIRILCLSADFFLTIQESLRSNALATRVLSSVMRDNDVFFVVAGVWPLALGIALWRTGWGSLLKAAAITFLMLGTVAAMEAGLGWIHDRALTITVGSFHLSRAAVVQAMGADRLLGLLGSAQILAELATGVYALRLALVPRAASAFNHIDNPGRTARLGRLALYASLGFAALLFRVPVWSAYVDAITRSAWFRDYVLNSDLRSRGGFIRSGRGNPQTQQLRDLDTLLGAGGQAWNDHQYFAARDNYSRVVKMAETIQGGSSRSSSSYTLARSLNNLSWLLSTCPDESIRDAKRAVEYAKRAVELAPRQGLFWNSLGVAYYRAGEWEEAKDALYRSMELRNEGDSFDWFFLCLVHLKLGDKGRAHDWYDRAVDWFHTHRPNDEELYHFQVEASEALGLPKPPDPPPRPKTDNGFTDAGISFPFQRHIHNRTMGFPSPAGRGTPNLSPEAPAPPAAHEHDSPRADLPRSAATPPSQSP